MLRSIKSDVPKSKVLMTETMALKHDLNTVTHSTYNIRHGGHMCVVHKILMSLFSCPTNYSLLNPRIITR